MSIIVNAAQAKNIDSYSIKHTGIPSLVLMERAAYTVARTVADMSVTGTKKILAVCGLGNNGGDGIAAARILHGWGYDVSIAMLGEDERLSEDARTQLLIARNLSVPVLYEAEPRSYSIIIDAIFGIGISRDVKGVFASWIQKINKAYETGSKVVAVDIPSGINTDTGAVMAVAVKADVTVTFGYEKLGLILYPGTEYAGRVICEDIGFDPKAIYAIDSEYRFITYKALDRPKLPARKPDSNKGTCGRVLTIAGSKNMAGAAYLSAKAAYRMGAGLVSIYTAHSNREILQTLVPEAVLKTWGDSTKSMTDEEVSALIDAINMASVVVLGPGLGTDDKACEIVRTVLESTEKPVIIDADALNILANHIEYFGSCRAVKIITPHLKELSRLTQKNIQYLKENLVQVCAEFSRRNGVICIAKDARTYVIDETDNIYINTSGNDGMATGGSGDVLTGIIAGLIAQGMDGSQAARLGVYIHGLAGDAASEKYGKYSMTAPDIAESISCALKNF